MRGTAFLRIGLIEAGVDPKTAETDACRIEHVISEETFRRLKEKYQSESESNGL